MNDAAESALRVRWLGRVPYAPTWQKMIDFVDARGPDTADELWLLEHDPVYTLGLAGNPAHVLDPGATPVIKTDRGGQVTWHGPGQLVAYVLLDLRRRALGPRELVRLLEEAAIRVLARHGLRGERRPKAPGVYVDGAKIAALGLRIRRYCSYHGLALNVAPELAPFTRINPCGYAGLAVTSLAALGVRTTVEAVAAQTAEALCELFGFPTASASLTADNAGEPASAVGTSTT